MKALTTVKEVATPTDNFEISGTAIPEEYLEYELNEWDDYAVEEAVQLAENGVVDEVVAVTIGPERAEETIRMALAKGADRAIRIWDDDLADADFLDVGVKARIFAEVVADESPDVVLSGVQADDDQFGATGVALAETVGFEWAAVVNQLDHDLSEGVAHVRRELEGGIEEVTTVDLPAVLSIQTGINEPRYASLRGIRQAQRKELRHATLADLGLDASALDADLELTAMTEPESESDAILWEGSAEETAATLAAFLRDEGVIDA